MSEAKQTAVEWLYDRFLFAGYAIPTAWKEQAKQMEKEQIKDAYTDGCIGELYELNAYYTSEKYYNKTYDKGEPKR